MKQLVTIQPMIVKEKDHIGIHLNHSQNWIEGMIFILFLLL
jgi:hypothetical protein